MLTCKLCGEEDNEDSFVDDERNNMIEGNMCFDCVFWTGISKFSDDPNSVRIDNHHYFIHPPTNGFRGFGGREFRIRFRGMLKEVITKNLWHQGEIPEHFREKLFDNAIFVEGYGLKW